MKRNVLISVLTILGCVLVAVPTVSAVEVTQMRATLLDDDFENSSQVSPYTWDEQNTTPAKQSDSDPDSPAAGSWSVGESPAYAVQVTDSAASPDPDAYQGDNYMRLVRSGADVAARGDFSSPVTGGDIHIEFMAYIPTASADSGMKVVVTDGDDIHGWTDHRAAFMTRYDGTWGNYLRYWDGAVWVPAQGGDGQGYNGAVIFQPDTWQQWEVDVDLDSQTWTLSVGGQTSFARPFGNAGNTAKAVCFVPAGDPKTFYVDQVIAVDPCATPTTDVTLVQDDFLVNDQVSGYTFAQQVAGAALRTDSDPEDWMADWTVQETIKYEVQVTDSAVSPDPGGYVGDNYLRVVRSGNADAAARVDFTQITGGIVRTEFMAYVPADSAENGMKVTITDGDEYHGWTDHRAAIMTRYDAGNYGYYLRYWTGSSWNIMQGADAQGYNGSVIFQPDTWQKWQIDVNLDTEEFVVRIGGQTSYARSLGNSGNTVKAVTFVPGAHPRTFYIDATTEFQHPIDITWSFGQDHPTYRKGTAVDAFEGNVITAGGIDYPWDEADTVYSYSPSADSWEQLPDLPVERAYTDGITIGDAFYLIGGRNGNQTHEEVYKLQRSGGTLQWSQVASMQDDRGWYTVAAIGNRIIVAGGNHFGPGEDHYTATSTMNSVECYDANDPGAVWQSLAPIPGQSRGWACGAVVGNKMYLFGGTYHTVVGDQRTSHRMDEALVYDNAGNSWSSISSLPFPLSGADAIAYDNRYIIIMGGFSSEESHHTESGYYNTTVLAYDTQTDTYDELRTPLLKATNDIHAALIGQSIYAVGGENNDPGTANTTKWLRIGDLSYVPRCGDENHPHPQGDLDLNCRVDLADLGLLADDWLNCSWGTCD